MRRSNIFNHRERWHRNLQGEFTDIRPHLDALYDIGKELDFVVFTNVANSDEFVQFRLIRDDDCEKIVQLSIPQSDAVSGYRDKILNIAIEDDLPVTSQTMELGERPMKYDHIMFGDDMTSAAEFSKAVFEQVFGTEPNTKINIYRDSGDDHSSNFWLVFTTVAVVCGVLGTMYLVL